MYRALTKIIISLWGQDEEHVSRRDHSQDGSVGKTDNVWCFDGKITSLHNGYGLVNEEVYFSQDLLAGCGTFHVGQPVYVCARRRQRTGGWRAESVSLNCGTTQWTDTMTTEKSEACGEPKTLDRQQEMIAVVTSMSTDSGCLNETISFHFADVADEFYIACVGDTVTAVIVIDDATSQQHAVDIKPLRQFDFEGQITAAMSDHGYIVCPGGVDVYFSYEACGEGYRPHRGDLVNGTAVETTRGQCQWRALNVMRRYITKQSPDLLNRPPVWSATESLRELLAEKEGINITGKLDFGELHQGIERSTTITIQNNGSRPHRFASCRVLGNSDSQFSVTLQHASDGEVSVVPGASTSVTVLCRPKYLGMDKRLLIFDFETFKIGRHVTVKVEDPRQSVLGPTSVYHRAHASSRYRTAQEMARESWVVTGQRPARRQTSSRQSSRLLQYPVPEKLRTWLTTQGDLKEVAPVLTEPLGMDNYVERFSVLLHLEELQQEVDLLEFSMDRVKLFSGMPKGNSHPVEEIHTLTDVSLRQIPVCLHQVGEFLALTVPGLSEGRPSLLPGDRLVLSEPCELDGGPKYEGYIHEVLKDEVLLKFHTAFHETYQGANYDVHFLLNRATLRRSHQAAHCAPQHGVKVLFPDSLIPKITQVKAAMLALSPKSADVIKVLPVVGIRKCPLGSSTGDRKQKHKFFNEKLNSRQRAAVMRMLGGQCRPTPYILFGPPGTGKTMTVVESVLQIFEHVPSSRLVVCAPSNSAADLLAERLHSSGRVKTSQMVRLNAFQRIEENIHATVQPYCRNADELELVARHRIIVCTCSSAALLGSLSLSSGHFTHVFVDEAGQATEPECLISMCLLAGSDGQTVLAGDPLQLGAVLRSQPAKQHHLHLSLLERLIQRPLYKRDESKFADHGCYDPFLVTKLIENYRSHSVLLQLPSVLFYDGELQCSGDPSYTQRLCDWDMLPNKDSGPLIFHGIQGEDLREGNSPSWFNPVEVVQVVKYVQALISSGHNLTFDDIGVITPYRKQVEKIRLLIDRLGMEKVKVGSVEEFQGQERLAMIISTVRSNETQLGSDCVHNLGFLSNPKRFNVAITRAQALLIIVGNPHILSQDPYWQALIQFCVSRGTYVGCDLPHTVDWCHQQGSEREDAAAQICGEKSADVSNSQVIAAGENRSADKSNGQLLGTADEHLDGMRMNKGADGDDNLDADRIKSEQDDVSNRPISTEKGVERTGKHSTDVAITGHTHVVDNAGADITKSKRQISVFDNRNADICNVQRVEIADGQSAYVSYDQQVSNADKECADMRHSEELGSDDTNSADDNDSSITAAVDVVDNTNADTADVNSQQIANSYVDITKCRQKDGSGKQDNVTISDIGDITDSTDADVSSDHEANDAHKSSTSGDADIISDVRGVTVISDSDTTVCEDIVSDTEVFDVTRNDTMYEDCTDVTIYEDSTDVTLYEDSNDKFDANNGDIKLSMDVRNGTVCDDTKKDMCHHKNGDVDAQKHDIENHDDTRHIVFDDTKGDVDVVDDIGHDAEMCVVTLTDTEECHESRKGDDNTLGIYMLDDKHNDTDMHDDIDTKNVWISNPVNDCAVAPSMIKGKRHNSEGNQDSVTRHVSFAKNIICSDRGQVSVSASDSRFNYNNSNSTDGLATTAKITPLEKRINRQLQYYFGDFNLMKDLFLQKHIRNDTEGWVDLSLLVTFKRLNSLTTDFDVITSALRKCTANIVEVSPCGTKVRRSTTNPLCRDLMQWKEDIKNRSVAVAGCGTNFNEEGGHMKREHIDDQQAFFEFYGDVEHIQQGIWKRMPGQREFTELDLVVFHRRQAAEKLARSTPIQQSDRTLVAYFGDTVLDEAVEWLYDLHVRKIKKCRIQPVGSRRQIRTSSSCAASKREKGYPTTSSRSKYLSNQPRKDRQQCRSFFMEQASGSRHDRKDNNRRGEDDERAHSQTEADGIRRGTRGDVARDVTGWTRQRATDVVKDDTKQISSCGQTSPSDHLNKDNGAMLTDDERERERRSAHTYTGWPHSFASIPNGGIKSVSSGVAVGRGTHVAHPLSLSCNTIDLERCTPEDAATEDSIIVPETIDQPACQCTSPVNSSRDDDDLTSSRKSPLATLVTSHQTNATAARETVTQRNDLTDDAQCSFGAPTWNDNISSAPSPIGFLLWNDNNITYDGYSALNQTDSDVFIEESGSEDDEDWT